MRLRSLGVFLVLARLRSQLPEGRKVGRMVRPEWVEQWIEEGTHGIEAA